MDLARHVSAQTPIPFREGQSVIDKGEERLRQVLSAPNPPTAIFFTNYLTAMGGLNALNSSGMQVPDDLSLVCFDYDPLFRAMHTSLACVAQDLTAIGTRACELLMKRISGDYSDFPATEIIDVQFHHGRSVRNISLLDQ